MMSLPERGNWEPWLRTQGEGSGASSKRGAFAQGVCVDLLIKTRMYLFDHGVVEPVLVFARVDGHVDVVVPGDEAAGALLANEGPVGDSERVRSVCGAERSEAEQMVVSKGGKEGEKKVDVVGSGGGWGTLGYGLAVKCGVSLRGPS